jgi:hypothetical protein
VCMSFLAEMKDGSNGLNVTRDVTIVNFVTSLLDTFRC